MSQNFKMAAEPKEDGQEQIKATVLSDSRNTTSNEFYSLMEQAITNLSELNTIVERLALVITSLDCNSDLVKFTLEFYKNLHAFPTESLLLQLFTREIITDQSVTAGKSCFGPFLSQLLFQSVTQSSVECAKYSTKLWIDRMSNENGSSKTFPNPLEYLDPNSPTKPSAIPPSVLLQFKLLDDKQRKLIILDFRKMANLIPPMFYPRMIVAFLIFLEFYRKEVKRGGDSVVPEIFLWAETWHNLVISGLTGSRSSQNKKHLPLHHILNGTMVSTRAFEFLSTMPDLSNNVLKSLSVLHDSSSGFTNKWVTYLLSELKSS